MRFITVYQNDYEEVVGDIRFKDTANIREEKIVQGMPTHLQI